MNVSRGIIDFYEKARRPEMPDDLKENILRELECMNVAKLATEKNRSRRHNRSVRPFLATVGAVAAFAVVAALTLYGHVSKSRQRANATSQTKRNAAQTTYDYKGLLGFTPKMPTKLPNGIHLEYSEVHTVLQQGTDVPSEFLTFTAQYVDRTGQEVVAIREQPASELSVPPGAPPSNYENSVLENGETVYETGPTNGTIGWNEENNTPNGPQKKYAFLSEDGISFSAQYLSQEISEQQFLQLLGSLKNYSKSPVGTWREIHNVANLQKAEQLMPFKPVLPSAVPAGFKLNDAQGVVEKGVLSEGSWQPNNLGTLTLLYGKDNSSLAGIRITEKSGTSKYSLPFWSDPTKVGSFTVQYLPSANRIAWYDPTKKLVVQIGSLEKTSKATLMNFAKSMIKK